MKIRVLLAAGVLLSGLAAPAFAFEHSAPISSSLIQKVVCDANGDGKQANCMRECEEEEIRSRETYHSRTDEDRLGEKKACEKKCGC